MAWQCLHNKHIHYHIYLVETHFEMFKLNIMFYFIITLSVILIGQYKNFCYVFITFLHRVLVGIYPGRVN